MKSEELLLLIETIPQFICYIYPGYITLYLYYYFHSLTLEESKAKLLKSIAVSYMYIITLKAILDKINTSPCIQIDTNVNSILFNFLLFVISVLIPYLLYIIENRRGWVEKIKKGLGIKTSFAKNEIEVLQKKYNDTIWIYVYMRGSNIMYEGSLTEKELEFNKTRFFCLSKYRKYLIDKNGKRKKLENFSHDEKEKVVIYFDMISHFEVANVDKN